MGFIEILLLAVALAMDAFAVSIVSGSNRNIAGLRPHFRLAFHFGLFQFLMPVIGWFLGERINTFIADYDHWIVFIILGIIGARMIKAGFDKNEDKAVSDPSKGSTLILLSVATSLDALAVGFSLAILDVNIWYPSIIIGVITGSLSLIGLSLGNRLGLRFGKKMEIAGGVVLIFIGTRILISHLFGL